MSVIEANRRSALQIICQGLLDDTEKELIAQGYSKPLARVTGARLMHEALEDAIAERYPRRSTSSDDR